jgi:primosomal protein N' (replication factor Y)
MPEPVLKVAVGTPLNQLFDYLPGSSDQPLAPGQRVRVPFGRREQTGVIVELADQAAVPSNKLRATLEILDREPLLDEQLMAFLKWAARYYQHPPGEVFAAAMPAALRQGGAPIAARTFAWRSTAGGRGADVAALKRKATVQAAFLDRLNKTDEVSEAELREMHSGWRKTMAVLADKGWVECFEVENLPQKPTIAGPTLTDDQVAAVAAIEMQSFEPCLLEGVTGSGKTEVYLQLIQKQLKAGRQSLVLVPEIGLTPQLVQRFEERIDGRVVTLHSGLTDTQRLNAWVAARNGEADVIIGTRSAIFCPLARPGLIVVDEEHDSSYKQQDGFRYSARDLAVYRARQLDIPVILGSATPAFETLNNALEGRYKHLLLPARPGAARQPDTHTIDLRRHPLDEGLSKPLLDALRKHLEAGNQVLLYLNRRGYAPTLLCPTCGETEECGRCDARMVLHQRRNRLVCHHCGAERPRLEQCQSCEQELVAVGHGTERIEQALAKYFPDYPLVRIDRDTTRKRGAMEDMLADIRSGASRILLGTQMLTKGHDFPDVTCVGIIDSDQGLFGTDFRSSERLAQSILQVAGRAGRGDKPGEVWIQTWYPDHPLLQTLLTSGYSKFAAAALNERRAAQWPPFAHIALLRAESSQRESLFEFLELARALAANAGTGVRLLGPASSPMERRSGRFRAQLLVQSPDRGELQNFLPGWRAQIASLREARRIRWSLDIDPAELF